MPKPRTALHRICAYISCSQPFWIERARAERGRGFFCSKACWRAQQATQHTTCVCQYGPCSKTFTIPPNVRDNGRGTFCSRACANLSQRITTPLIDRLWENIDVCPHGRDCPYCCWPWTGTRTSRGYGRLRINEKETTTSRLIWEVWHQRLMPHTLDAAHYCFWPPCNNPSHLYPATAQQNAQDAIIADTWARGSRHGMAKLVEDDIVHIIMLHQSGMTAMRLARDMDVSENCIRRILRREGWRHVMLPE